VSNFFEYILDSDSSRDTQYKITFWGPDEVLFLEVSTHSAKPRIWMQIPSQIAKDLDGFYLAQEAAEEYFAQETDVEERIQTAVFGRRSVS
jgi:hypothetical protein